MSLRVLVLDGDASFRNAVSSHLAGAGMSVRAISSVAEMEDAQGIGNFDVVLCDVNPPGESGFSVAARLRLVSSAGLILMTAADKREDRILALSLGVDHFIDKSTDMRELELIIGNLHKRRSAVGAEPAAIAPQTAGAWIFDAARWNLTVPGGSSVALSLAEYLILNCLLHRAGEVATREELLAVLDRRDVRVYSRNVDMIISRLRRKVRKVSTEDLPVLSARGVGYVFTGSGRVIGEASAQA